MTKKIFCLEGEWEKSLKPKYSVESYLNYLDEAFGIGYIYRKVNSADSLGKYLTTLKKKEYEKYQVVYLAFHGDRSLIELDHSDSLNLIQLAELVGESLQGKIIHFGSCKTLLGSEAKLLEFKKSTRAKLVSGYTKRVDFFESSLLDMAYLKKIMAYKDPRDIDDFLKRNHPVLVKRLGFKVI
ncbi:hypothetical protein GYM62_14835 [Algoriphagus sp. NBT04N3]|jgi:hypothetical protein|uniref:DUF6642 family protein n=1 Tax=Algoriphagus sp. NBT04N3 TaxID=2705473 RepID=UPI001C639834|nr:DUF6642 family protein [Algoriphagus sp. NBT04N3]QYH40000.1 hypothetical protein GYM62_14835 [Algoriphagus sp. NBT04N3]